MITYIKKLALLSIVILWAPLACAQEKPLVLATTTDIADITGLIAGDTLKVEALSSGHEDPHFISALPGYIIKAKNAAAWICVGMELEVGWEGPILRDARNTRIQKGASGYIDASLDIVRLDVPQEVSRDMGDVHRQGNPHYWLDPLNGRMMAGTICRKLSALFPEHKDEFAANLEKFRLELDTRMFGKELVNRYGGARLWKLFLDEELETELDKDRTQNLAGGWYMELKPLKGKSIITYHKSWIYLTERFGIHTATELEPKPGIAPSPKHLASVIRTAKEQNVKLIIQEPFYSRKAADFVAGRTDAKVAVTANCAKGTTAAATYLDTLSVAVSTLAQGLK